MAKSKNGFCRLFLVTLAVLAATVQLGSPRCEVGSPNSPSPREWERILDSGHLRLTPQWSPDGASIMFSAEFRHRPYVYTYGTYIVAADGSSLSWLSEGNGPEEHDFSPDFSPDGSEIVYTTTKFEVPTEDGPWAQQIATIQRNFEIETSWPDGSHRLRLTYNGIQDTSPIWSPDGRRIAFIRDAPGHGIRGVYSMDADGSHVKLLHAFAEQEIIPGSPGLGSLIFWQGSAPGTGLDWSPDGEMLAFVVQQLAFVDEQSKNRAIKDSTDVTENDVLYVVGTGGAGLKPVFVSRRTFSRSAASILGRPSWSPDGSKIAFFEHVRKDYWDLVKRHSDTLVVDGTQEEVALGTTLYAVRRDGSGIRVLASGLDGPDPYASVSWAPDGGSILRKTSEDPHQWAIF